MGLLSFSKNRTRESGATIADIRSAIEQNASPSLVAQKFGVAGDLDDHADHISTLFELAYEYGKKLRNVAQISEFVAAYGYGNYTGKLILGAFAANPDFVTSVDDAITLARLLRHAGWERVEAMVIEKALPHLTDPAKAVRFSAELTTRGITVLATAVHCPTAAQLLREEEDSRRSRSSSPEIPIIVV